MSRVWSSRGRRIEPSTVRCDQRVRLRWPPCGRFVLVNGSYVPQNPIYNSPCLFDIAERARAIVKITATLDAEIFRHRDLHAFYPLPIPERLKKGNWQSEKKQVLNRVLGLFCRTHSSWIRLCRPYRDLPAAEDDELSLPSRSAIWPFLEKSIDSPRIRAASCGAWKPVEFSASTKSR